MEEALGALRGGREEKSGCARAESEGEMWSDSTEVRDGMFQVVVCYFFLFSFLSVNGRQQRFVNPVNTRVRGVWKLTVYIARVSAMSHNFRLLKKGRGFGGMQETRSVDRGTLQAVSLGGGRVSAG